MENLERLAVLLIFQLQLTDFEGDRTRVFVYRQKISDGYVAVGQPRL